MDSLQHEEFINEWSIVDEAEEDGADESSKSIVTLSGSCCPSLNHEAMPEANTATPSLTELEMRLNLELVHKRLTDFRDFETKNNLRLKQQKSALSTSNQIHKEKLEQINELSIENEGLKCKVLTLEENLQEGLKDKEALAMRCKELEENLSEVQEKLANQMSADLEEKALLRAQKETDSKQLSLLERENLQLKTLLEQKENSIEEQVVLVSRKDWKVAQLEQEVTEAAAKAIQKEMEAEERIATFECAFEALKAEFEECKATFDKERETWHELTEETVDLRENLLSVQMDNLNLTIDVDAMRRQQTINGSKHDPQFYTPNGASGMQDQPKFECPLCFILFETLDLLQNHLDGGDCPLMTEAISS